MIRTGLGFFEFMFLRGGRPEIGFHRFDAMLLENNRVSEFCFTIAF